LSLGATITGFTGQCSAFWIARFDVADGSGEIAAEQPSPFAIERQKHAYLVVAEAIDMKLAQPEKRVVDQEAPHVPIPHRE
jgi:hypothetical protein